jgi:DNA-binding response OmpR family regulator
VQSPFSIGRSSRVLVTGGAQSKGDALASELTLDGYEVHTTVAGRETLRASCRARHIGLVIFAPGTDLPTLLDLLRGLRAGTLAPQVDPATRVLWVSAADSMPEVLRAFAAGADDVARFPLHYTELRARVNALLARTRPEGPAAIECGELRIDISAHHVTYGRSRIELPLQQFKLLVHLAGSPGQVFSKHELLRDVWGYQSEAVTRTVDTHASRLRGSLSAVGARGWLTAVRGVGYKLSPQPHSSLRALP